MVVAFLRATAVSPEQPLSPFGRVVSRVAELYAVRAFKLVYMAGKNPHPILLMRKYAV